MKFSLGKMSPREKGNLLLILREDLRRQKLFKQKLMRILKRKQKKNLNCLFYPDMSINYRKKDKANLEDKEGKVIVLSLLLDSRRLELANNSRVLSSRSQAILRINIPS